MDGHGDPFTIDVDRLVAGGDHDRRFFFRRPEPHGLVEAEHAGGHDRPGGTVTAPRRSDGIGRPEQLDLGIFVGPGHEPNVTVEHAAAVCRHTTTIADVPEGEGIHRTAAALRTALVGRAVLSFEGPRVDGPAPAPGRVIELVEHHGKRLDISWDDGLILHTNLFFGGVWHLYRTGERWRKPMSQMRVGITVDGFTAVCFGARIVETYREFDAHRHPGFGRGGPDLCQDSADLGAAVDALCRYDALAAPIAEALLDQQVARGVGNVYRSEILWACRQHPLAPVSMLARTDMERVVNTAARVLHANLNPESADDTDPRSRLAVYGRNGQRCRRCGDTIEVRRLGEHARLLYWCPGCQVRRGPRPAPEPAEQREMDPHPAAAKFLSELPWRRRDTLAG